MIPALALIVTGYAVIIAVAALVSAVRRTARPGWLQAGAWTLLALLTGQAAVAATAVARGSGPGRPALFLAYLAVSVALLPICGAMTIGRKTSMAADATLAVAAVVTVIVQWRLASTWRGTNV